VPQEDVVGVILRVMKVVEVSVEDVKLLSCFPRKAVWPLTLRHEGEEQDSGVVEVPFRRVPVMVK